jgi:hypothetical protein
LSVANLEVVQSVKVEGYTGLVFLGKRLKKVDVTRGPDGRVYDDTAFAAEIGRIIQGRQQVAA